MFSERWRHLGFLASAPCHAFISCGLIYLLNDNASHTTTLTLVSTITFIWRLTQQINKMAFAFILSLIRLYSKTLPFKITRVANSLEVWERTDITSVRHWVRHKSHFHVNYSKTKTNWPLMTARRTIAVEITPIGDDNHVLWAHRCVWSHRHWWLQSPWSYVEGLLAKVAVTLEIETAFTSGDKIFLRRGAAGASEPKWMLVLLPASSDWSLVHLRERLVHVLHVLVHVKTCFKLSTASWLSF